MELESKLSKLNDNNQPHLSGAYFCSPEKQLTSSRTKHPMSLKDTDCADGDGISGQNLTKFGEGFSETPQNMAEARREIVTALKFHRAAMKQASEQQQQQSQPLHLSTQPSFDNFSYSSISCHPPTSNPYPYPEALNFSLPIKTLGLNLNLHDFNNLDTALFHNSYIPSNYTYSYSSTSSSSSPPLSVATEEHSSGPPVVGDVLDSCDGSGIHPALDYEEMAEIRSIGDQHQMEWNDKMNLVTSAWGCKFLKTMEIGTEEMKAENDGFHPFDEAMEFPALLNANESMLQQHFNDYCPEDYFQDPALPCLEIGEFEGMDCKWLS